MIRFVCATTDLLALGHSIGHAQDNADSLDSIVVTGSRISCGDLVDTPAIGLVKQGDFLIQPMTLVNDTRNPDGRREELHDSIESLLSAAGTQYELLYGYTYPVILNWENHKVELEDDPKRPDTRRISLQLRVKVTPVSQSDGQAQVRALREFLATAVRAGRTEIDLSDGTSLSMQRP